MIPYTIIVAATVLFFILERVLPGRTLPEAPGWYARAALLNLCQVGIVLLAGVAKSSLASMPPGSSQPSAN
jgi:hypothetical protein